MRQSYTMYYKFMLFLLLMMGIGITDSKAQLITLGTGTTASTNTEASPINGFYNYTRYQTVYTKAEINAAGINGPAQITSLAYFVTVVPAGGVPNWEIRMANTTAVDASTHNAAAVTNVYTSALPTFVANTWNTKTLTTPFFWDGTSNLLVDVDFGSAPFTTPYGSLYTYSATSGSRYIRCDACGSQANSTTNTTVNTKPQVQLNFTVAAACSGAPAPGNTLSTSNPACPSTNFTLSLQNNPAVSGLTYVWQKSPDGVTWTATGGTANTYTTSQTTATYYRANVSCGANTTASTPILVNMSPFTGCYCTPPATNCSFSDVITNVTLGSINNSSACSANGYADYFNTVAPTTLATNSTVPMSVTAGPGGTEYVGVWIDYDHSGTFDASEFTALGSANGAVINGSIVVPSTALLGDTRMRVRLRYSTANTGTDACTAYTYGETEDYRVTLVSCVAGSFSAQPTNTTVTCNANTSFSATATGSALVYQWQVSTDNGVSYNNVTNGGVYAGATTNTLTLTAVPNTYNGYRYRLNITGTCTASTNSNAVTLTVNSPLTPTVVPNPAVSCTNVAVPLTISVPTGTLTVSSGTISLAIPDNNPAGVTNTIPVSTLPTGAVITGISVSLNMTHTWDGDMVFALKSPNNSIINLDYFLSGTGGASATTGFTNTVLSSTGTTALSAGTNPYTATFKADLTTAGGFGPAGPTGFLPNSALWSSLYSGGNGNWILGMYDGGAGDVGTLTSWSITFTYSVGIAAPSVFSPTTGLYTDAAATVPYTGTPVLVVYAKPAVTTTYTVVTGTGVCQSPSSTITVTANTPVTISAQPANATVCTDKITSFSVTAAGTTPVHHWQVSTNGTTFTNLTDGAIYSGSATSTLTLTAPPVSMSGLKYRDSISGATPCGFINSATATLTVNPLPVISVTVSPYSSLFPGLTTTLTATSTPAAATYSWFLNGIQVPGATTGSYTADVNGLGSYTVKVTDVNGCTSTSAAKIITDSVNNNFFIYPNPSAGTFQVRYYSLPGNAVARNLFIYDDKGARIFTQTYTVGNPYAAMNVNLKPFGSGTYWVVLADSNGKRIKIGKVVIL